MKNKKYLNIYVDTNVMVNFFTGIDADKKCLMYLFSKRNKERLFTSALALVQVAQVLQTKKKSRAAFSLDKTDECLKYLISKFTVLDLNNNDIIDSISSPSENKDLEDIVHYQISQKKNCMAIITNNAKHFVNMMNVNIFEPVRLGIIRQNIS
ncbi:MAG: type II toxin-antitoxin system VapC family toxin [Prevotellaceae bacterium]|jgi:predicted nucleic acid-binding protein|nr:type II toxin-antitoxin system VapC family toxin [Prevotellaceae bacterium]